MGRRSRAPDLRRPGGIDGMYVQVLTGPALTAEGDWPISLECPRETARTIWQLVGLFTI
ncbi:MULTISPECIES: hypothetical protein [unclassified Rhodococcus (in: high G+C Gram-positive bacteria)]|uniref:hypothetical protein n=1 Tax=Rhodococcus sp. SJ-3 TaxID=3454628 RepID=UPI003F7A1E06